MLRAKFSRIINAGFCISAWCISITLWWKIWKFYIKKPNDQTAIPIWEEGIKHVCVVGVAMTMTAVIFTLLLYFTKPPTQADKKGDLKQS